MPTKSAHQLDRFIAFVIFLAVFGVGVILVPHIGPAWDEPDNIVSGGQYANFFQKGFAAGVLTQKNDTASIFGDRIYTQQPAIARYPPVPNYVGTAISLLGERILGTLTSNRIIIAFHLATVLFFALLVATVYMFGRLLGLSTAGSIFASAVTFLYPTLFGHGLSNLKDTAQVALFTLSLYFLARGSLTRSRRDFVLGAIVWGLALASKFNAIYVPIIWFVWNIVSRKKILDIGYWILVITAIGVFTAVAVWPYLWFDPIPRVLEVIHYFTSVGQGYKIFWDGALYEVGTGKALWWYPWANLLYVTPIPLLLLGIAGMAGIVRDYVKKSSSAQPRILLLIWFTIPLLRASFPHAAFYDGVRHFLEVLPAGILMAAIGFTQFVKLVNPDLIGVKLGKAALAAVILGQLLYINVSYFPYSSGYYNLLAQNPNERFDRDIEALSIKEAVAYLHEQYGAIVLWSQIGGHLSWYYLTPADRYVYYAAEADSIIQVNKSSHILQAGPDERIGPQFVLVHVISRGGAVFAWIYRKK